MPEGSVHPPEASNQQAPAPDPAAPEPRIDAFSAMAPRFNLLFRAFAHRFFRHFGLDESTVARLRALEERGSVVYVMRYASRLDYFLFNTLFRREGLRLSRFANGIRFYYYRPIWEALRIALRSRRDPPARADAQIARDYARDLSLQGQSFFLFLRTARMSFAGRRRAALAQADVLSAMSPRFNLFFRWFAHRFFRHFGLDDETVARLRELESRPTRSEAKPSGDQEPDRRACKAGVPSPACRKRPAETRSRR